jgi:glycosyltransferase involved in cell wall biosynthesis
MHVSLTKHESQMAHGAADGLSILHVLRAPVGGLFRHVADLARGQAARGHRVGVIADSSSGGAQAEAILADLSNVLALSVSRVPMSRQLGAGDLLAVTHVARRAADTAADVIHGHGAKGGAYVRLARNARAIRVYTPHGGSLHYRWSTPDGFLYLLAECVLMRRTDLFLFESVFGRDVFQAKVGEPTALTRVVHNGVNRMEFEPVITDPNATDLVFVGELRALKGVDVLLEAIALLARDGNRVTLTIAGEGPDRAAFESLAARQGMGETVRFVGSMPARAAFTLGRRLVVPSRAESLPYVVLEAAAAGIPLIATNVGGIAEIFGPAAADLVPPGDPKALARAIGKALQGDESIQGGPLSLQGRVSKGFSAQTMTDAVLVGYRDALRRRNG